MKKHLDRYALFLRYEFELKCEALYQAYFQAENYRRFFVGAAVLAYNGTDFKIFGGANMMNGEGRPKVCAEQQAIKNAYLNGYYDILVVYVIGKPQTDPDKESGKLPYTLHPCPDCRKLMQVMYNLSDDTIIMTKTFDEYGPRELRTLADLIIYHAHPRPSVVDFVYLNDRKNILISAASGGCSHSLSREKVSNRKWLRQEVVCACSKMPAAA